MGSFKGDQECPFHTCFEVDEDLADLGPSSTWRACESWDRRRNPAETKGKRGVLSSRLDWLSGLLSLARQ